MMYEINLPQATYLHIHGIVFDDQFQHLTIFGKMVRHCVELQRVLNNKQKQNDAHIRRV